MANFPEMQGVDYSDDAGSTSPNPTNRLTSRSGLDDPRRAQSNLARGGGWRELPKQPMDHGEFDLRDVQVKEPFTAEGSSGSGEVKHAGEAGDHQDREDAQPYNRPRSVSHQPSDKTAFENLLVDLGSVVCDDAVAVNASTTNQQDPPITGRTEPQQKQDGGITTKQQVRYGGQQDIENLAKCLDPMKNRKDLQGQEGIILKEAREKLCINVVTGRYGANVEYSRERPLRDSPEDEEGSPSSVGMAPVYQIRDRKSKTHAVEKCIQLADFSPMEVIHWCRLIHPVIVPLMAVIRTGNEVMCFSEYNLGCETLQRREERCGIQFPQLQALFLIQPLFEALAYMHEKGIVHMDIHGKNILINGNAGTIFLTLIDFGESKKMTECVSDGRDDRYDVWFAFHILIRFLGGRPSCLDYDEKKNPLDEAFKKTTIDERLRKFLQSAINERPRAVEALCHIDKLKEELSPIPVTGPPVDHYVPPEI